MSNRDNFSAKVKGAVAARACWHCSMAGCGKGTLGPSEEAPDAVANTGEAAHICAAAPGGRRYDATMTPEQRSDISNAIWLCADHARLIDRDEATYTAPVLQAMKREREKAAAIENLDRSGNTSIGGLLAIGPVVVCTGNIVTVSAASWTLELRHFLLGEQQDLISFIDGFDRTSNEDRYILSNEFGDGRQLSQAPTLTRGAGGLTLVCPIASAAQRTDAQKLGSILASHPETDDLYLDAQGHIARVAGIEALPQIAKSLLSMQRGENVFHPNSGMRFFEYFQEFAGSPWLPELMKIDVIRQASIPRPDKTLKSQHTPLQCVTRVRSLELLAEATDSHRLPIRLEMDVQGVGACQTELSIYMPTKEQMLERAKPTGEVQRNIEWRIEGREMQKTDAELRGTLLKGFYDRRHNANGWVPTSDIDAGGADRQVVSGVCGQLKDAGLIHWEPLTGEQEGIVIGMAKITATGVDVIEGAKPSPIAIGTIGLQSSTLQPTSGAKQTTKDELVEYDVALSFAGEDRDYVDKVAHLLRDQNIKVFYDLFEETSLWGRDLYAYLTDVYQKHAKFTVMFISASYGKKLWTNHERKAAQARAFSEAQEYILPARFDNTEIPGILPTTGYLSLQHRTPEELAAAIIHKLGVHKTAPVISNPPAGQLQIEVGESGGFFETGRAGSLYTHTRVLKLRISNSDPRRPLTGCKVQVMSIVPHEYDGPWILKEGFSLAAGDHDFIPLARYVEPDDIKKSPYGGTFFEILAIKNQPKPPSASTHVLTIRATAFESPFFEMQCKLWVDSDGRLRIEAT